MISSKTKKIFILILLTLAYFVFQFGTTYFNKIQLGSYNGVLMACEFIICLLMIHVDIKHGLIVASTCIGFSLLSIIRVLIVTHRIDPLPGLVNMIVYLCTLVLLSRQYSIRQKEAITDFLTGLSNRRGLYQLLSKEIEKGKPFSVIYLDFSNFKVINDNYNHDYGDYLLKLSTKKMVDLLGHNGTVSRIDGANFFVIVKNGCNVMEIAKNLLEKLQEKNTLQFNDTTVVSHLNCFAGIANYPSDSTDGETLIKYADMAMYKAEKSKSEKICVFDKSLEQESKRRLELENLIKEALENNYFYLVYQPQYKLSGKKLRGFETLLRLKTPDGTFVSPGEFIPVAEKTNLILKIDDWVIRNAMKQYKDIVLNSNKNITISVNVSAKNIAGSDFADKIKKYIDESGFPPENLEIEITEYCLVQSMEATIENIKILRGIGVQFALDDFGTGYTSLSYLSKLPVNLLKVDKSLIDNIENDKKSKDFVNAVISMGHLMGCEVISEGVENTEQLSVLDTQNCDFVQGYVWGKPLDYEVSKELALSVGKE